MSHIKAYAAFAAILLCAGFLVRRYPEGPRGWRAWAIACACAVVGSWLMLRATDTPWFGDYESAYYPAGRLILSDPSRIYGQQCAFGFVNLPLIALPFVPFSLLGYRAAVAAFTIAGLVLIAAALRAFMVEPKLRSQRSNGLLIALFVVNGPLWYSVREGNLTHFLLLPVMFALICLSDRRDWLAGAVLGAAAIIKLPLALFAGYLFVRGRFRALASFSVVIASIVGTSLLLYGPQLHSMWLDQCILPYAGKPLAAFNVQSISGFWARMYGGNTYLWNPEPIGGSFSLVQRGTSLLLLAVVGSVLFRAGRPRTHPETACEFSIMVLLVLLLSPLSWTHYFLLVLIPLGLFAGDILKLPEGRPWSALWWTSVVLLSLPLRGFAYESPTFRFVYDRFLASHHLYGALILLLILVATRWRQSQEHSHAQERS